MNLEGHQLNFCANPINEGTKKRMTIVTSISIAAATASAISPSIAMSVTKSDRKTVARTRPKPRIVTQTLLMAVTIASLSDFPLRASSRMRVIKNMS